ncbi:MAG: hypothetical protein FWE08_08020 [Oscillospiraceae bacterium]|nr:hypothetical protein [Oscillospiraceae bacterium]
MDEVTLRYGVAFVLGILLFVGFRKKFKLKEKLRVKKRRLLVLISFLPIAGALVFLLVALHSILIPENEMIYEMLAGAITGVLVGFVSLGLDLLLSRKSPVDDMPGGCDYPSVAIADSLRQQISEIYDCERTELPEEFYVFHNIPLQKSVNAKRSYAASLGSDEQVIFLYDDTIIGSAKSGFILTSKYLYSKSNAAKAEKVYIGNIAKITQATATKLKYAITVEMTTGSYTEFIVAASQEKRTAIVRILDETIDLLKRY